MPVMPATRLCTLADAKMEPVTVDVMAPVARLMYKSRMSMACLRSRIVTLTNFVKHQESHMGMWIEMGVFALVFVFAIHQFHDLKQEKRKRERKQAEEAAQNNNGSPER
jgi:hypothetical protein